LLGLVRFSFLWRALVEQAADLHAKKKKGWQRQKKKRLAACMQWF
jgi:hypothetical protein